MSMLFRIRLEVGSYEFSFRQILEVLDKWRDYNRNRTITWDVNCILRQTSKISLNCYIYSNSVCSRSWTASCCLLVVVLVMQLTTCFIMLFYDDCLWNGFFSGTSLSGTWRTTSWILVTASCTMLEWWTPTSLDVMSVTGRSLRWYLLNKFLKFIHVLLVWGRRFHSWIEMENSPFWFTMT